MVWFCILKVRGRSGVRGDRFLLSPKLSEVSDWPPFSALALSSSGQEHLGSLLASRIYCPAVPSGHWSSVTVQTSRASTECSHWADCIAYLTLRFRASLGIWAREREKAYVRSSPNWRLNSRLEKNELPKAEILQREFSQSDVWHCPVCLFSSWPKGQLHIVS